MKKSTKILIGVIPTVLLVSGVSFMLLRNPVESNKLLTLNDKVITDVKSADNIDAKSNKAATTNDVEKESNKTNSSDDDKKSESSDEKEIASEYNPNEIDGEKTADANIFIKKTADTVAYSKEVGEYVDGENDQAVRDQIAKDKEKSNKDIPELNKDSGNYVTEHFVFIPSTNEAPKPKKSVIKNDDGSFLVDVSGKDISVSADEFKKAEAEIKKDSKQPTSENTVAKAVAFSKVNNKGIVESYQMVFN